MNKIINRIKGIFNKHILLLLFTYFIFGIGGTYAYLTYQEEDTFTIAGNIVGANVDVNVELIVGNDGKLVPMRDRGLGDAINAIGGTSACVDNIGNLSCQIYKITLTNNASRLRHVTGSIELYAKDGAGNVYNNLKWQELSNLTTVKSDSNINRMGKSLLDTDITLDTNESKEWYIAVWISAKDYDQNNTDKGLFGGTVTFETVELSDNLSNTPNLDNGNLIPVYYDDTEKATDGTYGVWKKADSRNKGNSWYDYENKEWANAVIVDPSKKETYQLVKTGTTIVDTDIIAFYVWIPRYKYKVWNLNRQGTEEEGTGANVYSYPAFTNGIDIEFEYFEGSTGNIECIYDTKIEESASNLSDKCYYNGSLTPIKTTDLNTDYNDAWYTHPAFTFGGEEKEGFWIGKFETSTATTNACYINPSDTNCDNTNQNPRVLPNVSSLSIQNVSNQFTTSRKFQNYLSSDIDAHILTNLEWGAVAYLTHSIYGLCNDNDGTVTCEGINHNNSEGYFTGRSAGNIVGEIPEEKFFYNNDSLTTNKYNTYGYYDYKGYKLTSSGKIDITVENDYTKIASTTKNVTGVYDMSGGAYENVMGNMVDSSNQFYPSFATNGSGSNSWSGSSTLDSKYYNSYSNGSTNSDRKAFNRSRLGDATAEVLGGIGYYSAWKPGNGKTGTYTEFVYSSDSWLSRGGWFKSSGGGLFNFYRYNGTNKFGVSFRSSLS